MISRVEQSKLIDSILKESIAIQLLNYEIKQMGEKTKFVPKQIAAEILKEAKKEEKEVSERDLKRLIISFGLTDEYGEQYASISAVNSVKEQLYFLNTNVKVNYKRGKYFLTGAEKQIEKVLKKL